jgi:hypothetical protein
MALIGSSDLIGRAPGGRKLIAVVYADIVGYSRLIGIDDVGTIERLRALRSTLIDYAVNEHGGKIVQTGGDSLLVVFDSIDGAVRCAVEIQQHVPDYNRDHPPDRAIRFRVGINIADVIAEGTDLHGDGVNVAARLKTATSRRGSGQSRSNACNRRRAMPARSAGALSIGGIWNGSNHVHRAGVCRRDRWADAIGRCNRPAVSRPEPSMQPYPGKNL